MDKKDYLIGALIIIIVIMAIGYIINKKEYNETFENFKVCNDAVNTYHNFFSRNICEEPNREFKGNIDIEYVPNWIFTGYDCDIERITDKMPEDARRNDVWKSTIDCYKCNAP